MTDTPEPPVLHAVADEEGGDDRAGPPNGLEMRKNGDVLLILGPAQEDRYRLRPPDIGEYAKLRELDEERAIEAVEMAERNQLRAVERAWRAEDLQRLGDKDSAPMTDAEREEHRDLIRQAMERHVADRVENMRDGGVLNAAADAGWRAWIREVVQMLAGRQLPPDDQLPAWVGTATTASSFMQHWVSSPPPRGVR